MKLYRIRNQELRITREVLAADLQGALDHLNWRARDCFVMSNPDVPEAKTRASFNEELSAIVIQLNALSRAILTLDVQYNKTWSRENLVSISLTHLKVALINAHAWVLEAQEQLKEQEDATV